MDALILLKRMEKQRDLLAQALTYRRRLEEAVKAVGFRYGTCWCGVGVVNFVGKDRLMHTETCDHLYLALYGGEKGE